MESYPIHFQNLAEFATSKGCKVVFTSMRPIAFNAQHMTIFIRPEPTLENSYALAHEIGHLLDYLEGKLVYDRWYGDWNYRVAVEMSAWTRSYDLLHMFRFPLDGWRNHVNSKLSTYFNIPEVKK
jgi:hypothetical protein